MVCKRAQLSFSTKTCNSADTSAVGLVAADPCGYELCCPVLRQQCRLHIGGSPGVCRSPRISLWRHLPKENHSIPFTCHRNMRKKKRKGQNCHCLCVVVVVVVHCTLYIVHIVQVSARDFPHQHSLPGESVRPKWLQQCHRAALGHGGPMPGREMTTTCRYWSFVSPWNHW